LQVAVERGAKDIVGIDLLPTEPVAGAEILRGDFTAEGAAERLIDRLGQAPDLILSDMAPNTIGHKRTDHLRIMALLEEASAFALANLRPGGAFLAKAFQGGETAKLAFALKRAFAEVRYVKPKASRAESSELYLLARGFKG
jgi:23S rRNA (uridine2552-2'-O)-methyltransferase